MLVTQDTGQDAKFLITDAGLAGELAANIVIKGISGVTINDLSMSLQINNTSEAINETFDLGGVSSTLILPAGPYLRVEVNTSLEVFGQELAGTFAFEQVTSAGLDDVINTTDDEKIIRVAVDSVEMFLGDNNGTPADDTDDIGVRIFSGTAIFLITGDGFAGEINASATVRISDGNEASVENVRVAINDLDEEINEEFRIGGQMLTLLLPAGPYIRVEINGLVLEILGQQLTGDFAFERVTLLGDDGQLGGGDDQTVTRVEVSDLTLRIATDQRDFVTVSDVQGYLRIIAGVDGGIFGQLSATVSIDVPNISVSGAFELQINSTAADQVLDLGYGQTVVYLRKR